MAVFASNEGTISIIFVPSAGMMRTTSGIFFMFLFGLTACSAPDQETILIGQIHCSGLPALPKWVQIQVEEEISLTTAYALKASSAHTSLASPFPGCLGSRCLLAMGEDQAVDLVLGGSVERVVDRILISWRLVQVNHPNQEWLWVNDYPYIPDQLETTIRNSIRQFIREIGSDIWVDVSQEGHLMTTNLLLHGPSQTENAGVLCSHGDH